MRILVTGVTGQVGGALAARLPPSATVLAADRGVLDLAEPQTIVGTLDRLAPDIIFNPAAYTAVDKAEDEPELAMRVNAEAPGRDSALGGGARRAADPFLDRLCVRRIGRARLARG